MKQRNILTIIALLITLAVPAQKQTQQKQQKQLQTLKNSIDTYLANYRPVGQRIRSAAHLKALEINDTLQTVTVVADSHFGEGLFTPQSAEAVYEAIHKLLPTELRSHELTVTTGGWDIRQLVPTRLQKERDPNRLWGETDYEGHPWVSPASRPFEITQGLQNRHLSVWASHGRYFNVKDSVWKWQRPPLFGTREDLFTQTIVTPYLIPMLERAGAVVFTPRERDWQIHEALIDNDTRKAADGSRYKENNGRYHWQKSDTPGFAFHEGGYREGENPFEAGTARVARTVEHSKDQSEVIYIPTIPKSGRYAVYVSYQTLPNSIDDAHYTVKHRGVATEFRVNQQMGGSTWVYLGTFDFSEGNSVDNCVVVDNRSSHAGGVVTADGVRFGGGMGNTARGRDDEVSGLPRCLEGARYYAQWAGMPYSVYSSKEGQDDYGDDINARSLMTNHLAGGSVYMPDTTGLGVPIELSLAVHSDAGFVRDGKTHTGTLAICTTYLNDSVLNSGRSRLASRDLADELLTSIPNDMQRLYGEWQRRELFDRNYSESRVPGVPSAIIETMSHQNFADMRFGQDPNFRFDLARSIYKVLLRYISRMHGVKYTVSPLAPSHLRAELTDKGEALLKWNAVDDPIEQSAKAEGYVVYTAIDNGGFDNGQYVRSRHPQLTLPLEPGHVYSFQVTAVNEGGESFPSEVVSCCYEGQNRPTVLVVNAFHRLASPAVRDNQAEQGFDLEYDPGVSYGLTAGWVGLQTCFNKATMGSELSTGLGFTNDSLAGQFIAGNDFNYIRTHADAIASAHRYNIISCSSETLETNEIQPLRYEALDLILGLQKDDGYSLRRQQAFTPMLRQHLQLYTQRGGRLLVSGSYVGSDMRMPADQRFLEQVLHCRPAGADIDSLQREEVEGLGMVFDFYRQPNDEHYAAHRPDVLLPADGAFSAMLYADNMSASVAYKGDDSRTFTMGFPLECVRSEKVRGQLMRGILNFLLH